MFLELVLFWYVLSHILQSFLLISNPNERMSSILNNAYDWLILTVLSIISSYSFSFPLNAFLICSNDGNESVFDNGFEPISADWMRTKINSKQRCYKHINYKGYVDEEWNKCQILNRKSVSYGIDNIQNKNTLNRYLNYGLPLQIGKDIYEISVVNT